MTRHITSTLADLEPEWIYDGKGRQIGMLFDCPVDDGDGPHREGHRVAVLFSNPPDGGSPHPPDELMIGDNCGKRWRRAGEVLELMTIEPSIDCTKSDEHCWHGHVIRGKVSG